MLMNLYIEVVAFLSICHRK